MDFTQASTIIQLVGMIIFVPSYFFQVYKIIFAGKNTVNFAISSWTMNFLGRYLWIIYSTLASLPIMIIGQGIVAFLSVPILYYSIRNNRADGVYLKENFNIKLFSFRVFLGTLTVSTIIIGILIWQDVISINMSGSTSNALNTTFGWIATVFTGFSFLPQGIKVLKYRKTESISFWLSSLFTIGNTLLVISLIVKITETHDTIKYIGGIVLPSISSVIMASNTVIKSINIIKHHEKF